MKGATVRAFDPRANDTARAILPSSVTFAEDPTEACCRANAVALLTERTDIVEADWRTSRHPWSHLGSCSTAGMPSIPSRCYGWDSSTLA